MNKLSFNLPMEFGDLELKKVTRFKEKWQAISLTDFLKLPIGMLFDPDFRLVVEMVVREKTCRVVNHQEDFDAIKTKFPEDLTLHLEQLYNSLKTVTNLADQMPTIFMATGILGAEVL